MIDNPVIRVECDSKNFILIDDLIEFQGELKSLSKMNYQKMKKSILDHGISEPFSVWNRGEKPYPLLNGHQRHRTLIEMRKEGYEVPLVPVTLVEAKTEKQAKRKLLALASQYGKIEKKGLYDFMQGAELLFDEVSASFEFPEVNMEEFKVDIDEFKASSSNEHDKKEDTIPEVPKEAMSKRGDIYLLGGKLTCDCGEVHEL